MALNVASTRPANTMGVINNEKQGLLHRWHSVRCNAGSSPVGFFGRGCIERLFAAPFKMYVASCLALSTICWLMCWGSVPIWICRLCKKQRAEFVASFFRLVALHLRAGIVLTARGCYCCRWCFPWLLMLPLVFVSLLLRQRLLLLLW